MYILIIWLFLIRNSFILFSHKMYVLNKNVHNLENYEEKTLSFLPLVEHTLGIFLNMYVHAHIARCVDVRNADIVITLFWNSGSYSLFTE